MFKKLKMVSKSRTKLIAMVTVLFIGMVFANILLTDTDKLTADVSVEEEFNYTQTQIDSPTPPELEITNEKDSTPTILKNQNSDVNQIELEVSISDVIVEDINLNEEVYNKISIDDCGYIGQVGHPKLPLKTLKLLLPYGKDLDKVNIVPSERYILDGKFKIEPAQAPIYLGSDYIPKFVLENSIYQSEDIFPENLYSLEGVYELRGYRILILNVYPVQYIPNTGKISYFKDMKVQVSVSDNALENSLFRGVNADEEQIINTVDNPEVINTYGGNIEYRNTLSSSLRISSNSYDYVIITNEALKNSGGAYTFQDLADYKNTHGFQTTIVTVEYIYANYPGADNQEKIRNFIIDAYQTWGIQYVLLGGDKHIVPHRGFYGEVTTKVYYDNNDFFYYTVRDYNIPSDLYYSGLDGTWDNDGDGIYGEVGEEDFYAEVYVGRAPVDSEEELSNFIRKTLIHEEIDDPYLRKALMVGEDMGWKAWGGDYKDEIKEGSSAYGYTTVGFQGSDFNVDTLYDRNTNPDWNKNDLISLINDGVHIINHIGHSEADYNMKMDNDDVDSLLNDKYFFGYSQGCHAGAFDMGDCIVEHFITSEHGAFAYIANSRYGWGAWSGTNGASQHYDREFFDAIFEEDIKEIGKANQDSKEDSIGYISQYAMRWCYYTINLFGDPTTSIIKPYRWVSSNPININDGGSHNWEWAKAQGLCSGSGTETDPYIIETLAIDCGGSGSGIFIRNSNVHFKIEDCIISNSGSGTSDAGIKLINTNNGYITNNYISQNFNGIYLDSSNYNTLCGNLVNKNDNIGIKVRRSGHNDILENLVKDNNIGIWLVSSNDNTIYHNSIIDNSIQAQDDGTNNNWDDGAIGNYWDDYTGIDADGDGIGDTPYIVSGTAGAIDNYPIMDLQPTADFVADKTTVRKGKSVQFTFEGNEGNLPLTFNWYFGDGSTSNERNPTHTYNKAGKYTVKLTITDVDGDTVTEIKIDYITATNPPKPVPGFTFFIFLITSIIGGASVIFMLRRKVKKSVKIPKK